MTERRRFARRRAFITTIVRKNRPQRGQSVMEFISLDLSPGGVFISTGQLRLFDLGEEVQIMVDCGRRQFREGRARVVRSARVFCAAGGQVESGFGLMFVEPGEELRRGLLELLARLSSSASLRC